MVLTMTLVFSSAAEASHWRYGSSGSGNQGSSGIGIVGGSTYGIGLGFRHSFKNSPVGIQLAGFPLITPKEGILTAGAGLQFTMHSGTYGRAFISVSGAVIHSYNGGMGTVKPDEDYTLWAVGPGVGIEFKFLDNFSFVIDVPAASFFQNGKGFVGMFPIPNTSFMFTW